MGPYVGVDYNLTLCPLQHIYHGQPYARVDLNPMPEYLCKFRHIRNFAFYVTTKWVCCLHTSFDVGLVARNILSLIYNSTAKEM
jgi:hypothetical protein